MLRRELPCDRGLNIFQPRPLNLQMVTVKPGKRSCRLNYMPPWKLNSRDRCWWEGKWFIFMCQQPEKMGGSCIYLKNHPNISLQAEVFIRRGGKAEQRDQEESVEKSSTCRPAQSISIRILKLTKWWFGVHHPGVTFEGQQISQNWNAWALQSVSFDISS